MTQAFLQQQQNRTYLKGVFSFVRQFLTQKIDGYAQQLGVPSTWIKQFLQSTLKPDAKHMQEGISLCLAILQSGGDVIAEALEDVSKILDVKERSLFTRVKERLSERLGRIATYYDFHSAALGFNDLFGQPDNQVIGTDVVIPDMDNNPDSVNLCHALGQMFVRDFKTYVRGTVPEDMHRLIFGKAG